MKNPPVVETQMKIRKPVAEVFEAFVNPDVTTKFWFTHSTGRLIEGAKVTWRWEMYGASAEVKVNEIVSNQLIRTEWGDPLTKVDYEFRELSPSDTYVVIRNYGFEEEGETLIETIKDNTGGFTTVLDGLKAWLEHGIQLNLVRDKFLK